MESVIVQFKSKCFVKPENMPEDSKILHHLSPFDLQNLSLQHIQIGLMFVKQQEAYIQDNSSMDVLLEKLKTSLSLTLVHFYLLAGRLKFVEHQDSETFSVSVDCENSPGARFVHAKLDSSVGDVLSPKYVPEVVRSLFHGDGAFNHEGGTEPLLAVQVTELIDGMFIGVSTNHCICDGTSVSSFLNSWSEIFQEQGSSRTQTRFKTPFEAMSLRRWFPDGQGPEIKLPMTLLDEFITENKLSLKERFFHLSPESVVKLKAKARSECNTENTISSLQAVVALLWRCITRARKLHPDRKTSCCFSASYRSRLIPPLSRDYYGNMASTEKIESITAGEVLSRNLGWAALKVNQAVANINNINIRKDIQDWLDRPYAYRLDRVDPARVKVGNSPRFRYYENEFGMGKPVAIRSASANKSDGKVWSYPGREGNGSIDLEVCLLPEFMNALESDQEFMSLVS